MSSTSSECRRTVQDKPGQYHLYCNCTVLMNGIEGSVTTWSEFGPSTESTKKLTRRSVVFHVDVHSRRWAHFWWTLWMGFLSQAILVGSCQVSHTFWGSNVLLFSQLYSFGFHVILILSSEENRRWWIPLSKYHCAGSVAEANKATLVPSSVTIRHRYVQIPESSIISYYHITLQRAQHIWSGAWHPGVARRACNLSLPSYSRKRRQLCRMNKVSM